MVVKLQTIVRLELMGMLQVLLILILELDVYIMEELSDMIEVVLHP